MELFRYWAEQPPVHVLLAAFMGLKRRDAVVDSSSVEWRALTAASGAPKPLAAVPGYVREVMKFDA